MAKYPRLFGWVISFSLLISACSTGTPNQKTRMEAATESTMSEGSSVPGEVMTDIATPDAMMYETPTEKMMESTAIPQAMMEPPDWYGVTFVNAATGEEFNLQDFEGKVILVETMAVWCTTCRAQQEEIRSMHEKLGAREDLISLSLDIDSNENQDDLKAYVEKTSFDWLYAVAPPEVSREIGRLYGDQFLNPPSAPVLIIDRHGEAHPLPFGVKSADELREAVNQHLDEM